MNNEKEGRVPFFKSSKGEYLVVLQFLIILSFILLPPWNPFPSADFVANTETFRFGVLAACGVIAMLFGGLGVFNLGKNLTPLPYPVDHNELVQTGVYRVVRHPLYSSQLFAGFGWVIFTLSLSHFLLLVAAFLFFSYKADKEEQWLKERHPEYAEYAKRVKKFIPFVY